MNNAIRTDRFSVDELRRIASDPSAAGRFVIALLATLEDDEEEVRAWACDALQSITTPPPEHAQMIVHCCGHSHPLVAEWACRLVSRLETTAPEHQSALSSVLDRHPSLAARQAAALSLGRIANLTPVSLESLRRASHSDDPRLSRLATAALATAQAT